MADHANSTNAPARNLIAVPFHGDTILTFEHDGAHYVAMRRIVENLELDWARQAEKLQEQGDKFSCRHMPTTGADGKTYGMLCMPVEKLALWLASINPNKVKNEIKRAKIERYQAESAIALHDYWTKGVAMRGDTDGLMLGMSPDVARAIGGIVKGVVHRQLVEIVPAMVEAAIASDPRRAVLDYVSVRQLLNECKAVQRKRRGLNVKVGYELRTKALINKPPAELRRCPHSGVWLYPRVFANAYMAGRGSQLVREHNDAMKGQGVLQLVRSRKDDEQSEEQTSPLPEQTTH